MCIRDSVVIVEKVMNDGSIGSTFNEGHLTVEGEDAYCIDTVSYTHLAFLARQPEVEFVNYPALSGSPYAAAAKKYLPDGCSGVLSLIHI